MMAKTTQKRPGEKISLYFEDPAVVKALDHATEETRRQNQIRSWSRSRQVETMLADMLGIRKVVKLYLPPSKPQSK